MKKLTKQQQQLFDQLSSGMKFATYNAHHLNNGEFRFVETGQLVRYRTFYNMQRALGEKKFDFNEVHVGKFNHSFKF